MAADKKLLKSISNFATALEHLVEELKTQDKAKEEKHGFFSKIFGKSGVSSTMKRVEEGIKNIKKDTTEIIKNQKELIRLDKVKKKQDKKNIIGDSGDKNQANKIKSGVGSIILIAAAVLAIGLAFKIIGPVDVVSVLALSLAITMLGHTLAKLQESGVPTPKDSLLIGFALLAFTTAVVASSWLLSLTASVSAIQLLTFGAIVGVFSLFSFGMKNLIKSTKGIKPMQILYLPLVLVGISLAIMASSYILQNVSIISPAKLINILLIGLTLGLISTVMSLPILLLSKIGKKAITGAFLSIVIMPALALGILLSSLILNGVADVPPSKLLSILLIGLTMGIIAIVMTIPMLLLSKMGKNAIRGAIVSTIIMPALALGILLSSLILQKVVEISPSKLISILLMGITLGVVAIVMSIPLLIMGKYGGKMVSGALVSIIAFPLMSMGIMLSSWILSEGKYDNPLPLDWVISFSLVMLILAIPVFILGKMDPVTLAFGALGIVLIAAAIMLSSWLFAIASPKGFRVIADAIAYFITVASPPIKSFVKDIVPILAKGMGLLFEKVLPPLEAFIKGVLPLIQSFIKGILEDVFPYVKLMIDYMKHIISSISGIFDSIGTMIEKASVIFPKIGMMFKMIGEGMSKPLKAIEGVIRSIGDVIVNVITSVVVAVEKFSQMDPKKLLNVGRSLKVIGNAISDLTGGLTDTVLNAFSGGKQDPITRILRSISDNGDGVDKVVDSLGRLPNIMKNLNNVNLKSQTFDSLINGINEIDDIKINYDNMDKLLNVLDRINKVREISGNIENVQKNIIEIPGLKNIIEPNNKEILEQLRIMNQQLYVISSNSNTISSQLNRLRDGDEPNLTF